MSSRIVDISPTKLVLILAGTFLVLAAAAWLILISPKESKVSSLETTIKSAQTQLSKLTQNEPAARKHAVSQTLLVTRALPSDVGMPQIVLQLSRIANEEHVSLDSIVPQAPVSYSGYQALPINIELSGDFFAVENFLQQLRNQVRVTPDGVAATGRLYDVLGVTLQAATPAPKVTATVTIDAFSYTGIATVAPGGTTSTATTR
jgi:Tfp pilus assembly protein PilO